MDSNLYLVHTRKVLQAYDRESKQICAETGLSKTAFDILMFLANNPSFNTAKDIVKYRALKANHVSVNVDKLVQEGYLERYTDAKDRRKVILSCTPKTAPIIEKGREMKKAFSEKILAGIPKESLETLREVMEKVSKNIDEM